MRTRSLAIAVLVAFLPLSAVRAQSPIKHVQVQVAGTNDEWTSTTLTVSAGDIVLVVAQGRVRIGQILGEVDANGTTAGDGALTMKIGVGAPLRVGTKAFHVAQQSGELKLRVSDRNYTDNSGAFTAEIVLIPAAALPPVTVVNP